MSDCNKIWFDVHDVYDVHDVHDVHESVHRDIIIKANIKMQQYRVIYYS
jgi:5'-deoxynucleotidase YfbR-like HD superfamily hydrolase